MSEENDIGPRIKSQNLPAYTYVPGLTPHPISDPRGHWHSGKPLSIESPMAWGVELFNRGYYWEAHEILEDIWTEQGRTGAGASLVKSLIKLAACGVKLLEGNSIGVQRHASRALELLVGLVTGSEPIGQSDQAALEQLKDFAEAQIARPTEITPERALGARNGGVPILGSLPISVQELEGMLRRLSAQ